MSIKYNGKNVAGAYNITPVTPSSDTNAGIIKIATEEELYDNLNNNVAITPKLLNKALSKSAFAELGDIGIAPLGIDEGLNLRRYLNGQTISQEQFKGFTTWLKSRLELYPTLSCTNTEFETACTMSAFGQCGKFVVDNENKTIRLPKIVNIQGLQELKNIGNIIEAGLPNISGTVGIVPTQGYAGTTGAFYVTNQKGASTNAQSGTANNLTGFDASQSNTIYGNSDTVQPEAIQYPYYIQVATGVDESIDITRELELNNPYSLGESKYSEMELNNASWLKSEGQYNSKTLYPSMYEWVLKNYNKTVVVDGVSVRLNTESYTDYDYVLNLNDETFRLPLLNGKESLPSDKRQTLTPLPSDSTYTAPQNGWYSFVVISSVANGLVNLYCEETGLGQLLNANATQPMRGSIPVSKGDVVHYIYPNNSMNLLFFTPAKGDGSLYYYIGDTIQDANIINAGSVINDVNNLKRNTLNTSQITNCITEIPQDIKLELKDGVLTLKAGSKVYVPNGFEVDGTTPKFDEVNITNDINIPLGTEQTRLVCINANGQDQVSSVPSSYCSGNTATIHSGGRTTWYDTANNLIKTSTDNGATWTGNYSFPIARYTASNVNGVVQITSLDQTFNGFGYIGSTVFVTKGVKALIPNGRNDDGSLRNIEFITNIVHTEQIYANQVRTFGLDKNGKLHRNIDYILTDDNYNHVNTKDGNVCFDVPVINVVADSSANIISFNPKLPFRAVDYSDSSTVSSWGMPSGKYIDIAVGASGSTYTAPANGYFYFYAIVKVDNCTLLLDNISTQGLRSHIRVPKANSDGSVFMLAQKGDTVQVAYDNSLQQSVFRFIYAEGEI